MCDACQRTVAQQQVLIDAIDKNREALNVVLDGIHQAMGQGLLIHRDAEGNAHPVDLTQQPFGRVLLLSYVAAFLAGEYPLNDAVESSIGKFYDTGFALGTAYATTRQQHMN